MSLLWIGLAWLLLCLTSPSLVDGQEAAASRPMELTFERDIRPILKAHCLDCHGATQQLKGGLDLRLRRFLVRGGDSGPAIQPGKPDESFLLQRIRDGDMPPGDAKVPADEQQILAAWIAAGAKTAREEPEQLAPGIGISLEERQYWAFQPVRRPDIPTLENAERVRTEIDALLSVELRAAGLDFAPDADRRTQIVRAALDLTGLPPTMEQIDAFVSDPSPDAYEKMIEQFLDSPHYGERWARHWLDAAGYADSEGYDERDTPRPYAYKYRDYVIRSLNNDKPFDTFIVEQLAGDELVTPPYTNLDAENIERLVATGFLRMAPDGTEGAANAEEATNQVMAETLKIVSTSLLGISVGCAQCHDHRYDPVSQTDYYRLRAIFEPALDWKNWRVPSQRRISLYTDADRAKAAEVEAEAAEMVAQRNARQTQLIKEAVDKQLEKFDEPLRAMLRAALDTPADKRSAEQQELLKANPSVNITPGVLYQYNQAAADELKNLDAKIGEVRARKPVEDFIRGLTEVPGQVPPTFVFHRGDPKQPTDQVQPGGLTIMAPEGQRCEIPGDDPELPTTGRRLAYARYLTNGKHPTLTRVIVNRVWMHHFGRPLVGTPGEFGKLGESPDHPQLLDYLADQFVRQGWSLKQLHRLIMKSTVYRQSSQTSHGEKVDPGNRLYWRRPIQRLDAEAIRDRILATSGQLKDDMFGPAVAVTVDDSGQVIVADDTPRRSIYVQVRRSQPVAMLTTFDAPVMQTNCPRRPVSNDATQALMMMNNQFVLGQAEQFAGRLRREAALTPAPTEWLAREPADDADRWAYGYGSLDEQGTTIQFTELPYWTGSTWQGGAELPDSQLGWVILHAAGGHPGNDLQHAAIRRWKAPFSGVVQIAGKLSHPSDQGDGVRARVFISGQGVGGTWTAQHGESETEIPGIKVEQGDSIDFVTDCQSSVTSDSFSWPVVIRLTGAEGKTRQWDSQKQFNGPSPPPCYRQIELAWQLALCRLPSDDEMQLAMQLLNDQVQLLDSTDSGKSGLQQAMISLCQVLLSCNEFLYVE